MNHLTEAARRIGSVNFVRREADGTLTGQNIDRQGFMQGLTNAEIDPRGATVVQLGVGGVGRVVAFALAEAGISQLTLINRDVAKAKALAADLTGLVAVSVVHPGEAPDLSQATLLVNATSLGMLGNERLPLNLSDLPATCFVTDVVIKPDGTKLTEAAQSLGCKTIAGTAMLMPQIELCEEFLYR